jgi:hypothetical protein
VREQDRQHVVHLEDKVAFLSRLSLLARFRWRIDQFLLRVHREGGDVEGSSRIVLGVKGQALSGGKVEDVLLHGVFSIVAENFGCSGLAHSIYTCNGLYFEAVIHDALQEEHSRSTRDIQARVIAFAVQEKNLKIGIDSKSFCSDVLAIPLILVQAYAGYT